MGIPEATFPLIDNALQIRDSSDVVAWIVAQAVERDDPEGLILGLMDRLRILGIPVWHVGLGMGTVDPTYRGISYMCWQDRPSVVEAVPHETAGENPFHETPSYYALSRGLLAARWNLETPEPADEPKSLVTFRQQGATDYMLRRVRFPRPEITHNGIALSFATKRSGGFDETDMLVLETIMPSLALAGRAISIARTTNEALSVYLGTRAAQRVMDGDIRRGHGQTISAAILIADLRGFTTLSEREDAVRVVKWLDEHFEVIGNSIEQSGGEVLKFLGDGLLAIFPFGDENGQADEVCQRAITAAEHALQKTAQLNAERARQGDPALGLGLVLHAGEVVYGNIGAARRLDFTVIGSAVNEASRMEGLCEPLGCDLLLSEAFSTLSGCATRILGSFDLRGLEGKRTIRTLTNRPLHTPPQH